MRQSFLHLPLLFALLLGPTARAEEPSAVKKIAAEKGKTVAVAGKIEEGRAIADLSFASKSSMACFPATQNEKFRAPHVLFVTDLPARSIMTVKVTPNDPGTDLSLYGYSTGQGKVVLPPGVATCVACEADHKWDRPKRGKTQDHTRSMKFNAAGTPYAVVIGISGPSATKSGAFKVEVTIE